MGLFLAMYLGVGLLFAVIAIPLMLRLVGPNEWYGFRVPKTLADPVVWYEVNAYSGIQLFRVGQITAITALILYLIPGMSLGVYNLLCATVLLVGLAISVIASFHYLYSVTR